MTRFAELDDAVVDDLLRGDTPAGHEALAPVAELAAALRAQGTRDRPEMGPALRAQITARPHVPPRYAGVARRRLQLAGAAAGALVIFGVAATHNALPAAAQRLVSNAADLVGIDVPRPEDEVDEPATTPAEGTDDPAASTEGPESPEGTVAPAPPATDEEPEAAPGANGASPKGAPPEETPGGAIPADPGGPGEPATPATPATPPPQSNGDNGIGDGSGGGRDAAPGQTKKPAVDED